MFSDRSKTLDEWKKRTTEGLWDFGGILERCGEEIYTSVYSQCCKMTARRRKRGPYDGDSGEIEIDPRTKDPRVSERVCTQS